MPILWHVWNPFHNQLEINNIEISKKTIAMSTKEYSNILFGKKKKSIKFLPRT